MAIVILILSILLIVSICIVLEQKISYDKYEEKYSQILSHDYIPKTMYMKNLQDLEKINTSLNQTIANYDKKLEQIEKRADDAESVIRDIKLYLKDKNNA